MSSQEIITKNFVSGFFDSIYDSSTGTYDRKYKAEDFNNILLAGSNEGLIINRNNILIDGQFSLNGIFDTKVPDTMVSTDDSDIIFTSLNRMTIQFSPGNAILNKHFINNSETSSILYIFDNNLVQNDIYRIVTGILYDINDRSMKPYVFVGSRNAEYSDDYSILHIIANTLNMIDFPPNNTNWFLPLKVFDVIQFGSRRDTIFVQERLDVRNLKYYDEYIRKTVCPCPIANPFLSRSIENNNKKASLLYDNNDIPTVGLLFARTLPKVTVFDIPTTLSQSSARWVLGEWTLRENPSGSGILNQANMSLVIPDLTDVYLEKYAIRITFCNVLGCNSYLIIKNNTHIRAYPLSTASGSTHRLQLAHYENGQWVSGGVVTENPVKIVIDSESSPHVIASGNNLPFIAGLGSENDAMHQHNRFRIIINLTSNNNYQEYTFPTTCIVEYLNYS